MPTTWNPADKTANITLSNGNLTAVGLGGAYNSVRATLAKTVGKYYFEVKIIANTGSITCGLMTSGASLTVQLGTSATGGGVVLNGTSVVSGFTTVNAPGVTWSNNDVMDFAVDLDAGKVWCGKNGTYPNSGNPATGVNPWATFTPNTSLFPTASLIDSNQTVTANFGSTAFANTVPTGFSAWTNFVLPAVQGAYALTGNAASLHSTRKLTAAQGSYALTGSPIPGKGYGISVPTGMYSINGITLPEVVVIAPASKFKRRVSDFVLQKLRVSEPTLGD